MLCAGCRARGSGIIPWYAVKQNINQIARHIVLIDHPTIVNTVPTQTNCISSVSLDGVDIVFICAVYYRDMISVTVFIRINKSNITGQRNP